MSTEPNLDSAIAGGDSLGRDRRRNAYVRRFFFICAAITIITTLAIFFVLLDNAASYFFGERIATIVREIISQQSLAPLHSLSQVITVTEFFTGTRWAPDHSTAAHGVLPIVLGTLSITVGAGLVSITIGTATALYLSEYATRERRNKLKPILEVLAGVPTIVYGYFAVSFITPVIVSGTAVNIVRPVGGVIDRQSHLAPFILEPVADYMTSASVGRYSLLAGIIVVGVMTIPMVSSISEDAMQAVPNELRDGAYALGASKYQVSLRIVLPAAVSGVFASYILALSRAIGETMAVTLGAGFNAQLTIDPFSEIMTMTAYMVSMARGTSAYGTTEYRSLFAVGLLLFLMTLSMNLINDYMKQRFQEEYR